MRLVDYVIETVKEYGNSDTRKLRTVKVNSKTLKKMSEQLMEENLYKDFIGLRTEINDKVSKDVKGMIMGIDVMVDDSLVNDEISLEY